MKNCIPLYPQFTCIKVGFKCIMDMLSCVTLILFFFEADIIKLILTLIFFFFLEQL